jgi:hypothetical protein
MRVGCKLFFLPALCLLLIKPLDAEEKKPLWSRFSLKVTAGLGSRIPIGDVNDVLKSFNDNEVFTALREANSDRIAGGLKPLDDRISHWEAELRFDLSPKIGFGIATSAPIHKQKESSVTYIIRGWAGDQIMTWTFKPEIRVSYPIKLSLYYTLPLMRHLNISVGGGVGLYSAKISQFRRYDAIYPLGDVGWVVSSEVVKNNFGLGFHGNIVLEYRLFERLALVTEFQARYAKISSFKGSLTATNEAGDSYEEAGTYYYFTEENIAFGARHATLEVADRPPEVSYRFIQGVREAVLNVSAYSLRIGIRVRVF